MHSIKIYVPCFEKFLLENIKFESKKKGRGQERNGMGFTYSFNADCILHKWRHTQMFLSTP